MFNFVKFIPNSSSRPRKVRKLKTRQVSQDAAPFAVNQKVTVNGSCFIAEWRGLTGIVQRCLKDGREWSVIISAENGRLLTLYANSVTLIGEPEDYEI